MAMNDYVANNEWLWMTMLLTMNDYVAKNEWLCC